LTRELLISGAQPVEQLLAALEQQYAHAQAGQPQR